MITSQANIDIVTKFAKQQYCLEHRYYDDKRKNAVKLEYTGNSRMGGHTFKVVADPGNGKPNDFFSLKKLDISGITRLKLSVYPINKDTIVKLINEKLDYGFTNDDIDDIDINNSKRIVTITVSDNSLLFTGKFKLTY